MTSTRTGHDDTAAQDVAGPVEADRPWAPRARGRHRRPRPRKVLFAAGGLALAAGVLSFVRLTPDPGGAGGLGTVEAEPQPDPVASTADDIGADPDTAADRGADRSADPEDIVAATPTAPSAMGGASAGPTPGPGLLPGAPGSPTSVALTPGATYTPAAPAATPAPHAPPPAAAATKAPQPPQPAPTTAAPAPAPRPENPEAPRRPAVCVPIIGLCVDPLVAN
ncbi:hypothetical protein ACWCQQ_19585 [Streptomyces sp. NPDC002143]